MTKERNPRANAIDACPRAMTDDGAIRQGGEVMKGLEHLPASPFIHPSIRPSIYSSHVRKKSMAALPEHWCLGFASERTFLSELKAMMEQHRDIICQHPMSLACWCSDTSCQPILAVCQRPCDWNNWPTEGRGKKEKKGLELGKKKKKKKSRWRSSRFLFLFFQFLLMVKKWPVPHKSLSLCGWKPIVQSC